MSRKPAPIVIAAMVFALALAACAELAEERGPDAAGARTAGDLATGRGGGPIGWASVDALGQNGTTGGGAAETVIVTTEAELWDAASGDSPQVIRIAKSMQGSLDI